MINKLDPDWRDKNRLVIIEKVNEMIDAIEKLEAKLVESKAPVTTTTTKAKKAAPAKRVKKSSPKT